MQALFLYEMSWKMESNTISASHINFKITSMISTQYYNFRITIRFQHKKPDPFLCLTFYAVLFKPLLNRLYMESSTVLGFGKIEILSNSSFRIQLNILQHQFLEFFIACHINEVAAMQIAWLSL